MITKNSAIGVLDSGVGGLTTVKELQNLLPKENIIYFGDNKNVPYGNKSKEEIIKLTRNMIEFLIDNNVKIIAVACNTISTIIDYVSMDYDVEIIKVIDPVVYNIKNTLKKDKVGLIATNFTVKSGYYDKMLGDIKVYGKGLSNLAGMIDSGSVTREEVIEEIKPSMDEIITTGGVDTVVLGCTHYPIVKHIFEEIYPNTNFINPALQQAEAIKKYLEKNNLLKDNDDKNSFKIYTSGDINQYKNIINLLDLKDPDVLIQYNK
ncbi:glutamate racemase [Clostridium rectalis]|uniref:glutamate racemase n=1 Tax=Clostridium rectalis TaxID=2040295 RepID=UPI0013DE71D4|nr:glutamate racemase [Clostridium rectalis]